MRNALADALFKCSASLVAEVDDQPGFTLAYADMPWDSWARRYFPSLKSFAQRHVNAWEWFESLTPGIKPKPLIAIFSRGGGKSSTVELCAGRVCARLNRRFMLIVSETQDQADAHVQSISAILTLIGAQPKRNDAGRTSAWRREQLRTANGFNIAAFGLNTGARGIKIDQFRPDIIVFDDIDSVKDSMENIQKKIDTITRTILPTGSSDCAVVLCQNLITSNSIASQLCDDRAKFLLNRTVPDIEPAVRNLEVKAHPQGPGLPDLYQVIGGEPTWDGQDIKTCEEQINEWGYETFLRESQHEVKIGGELSFPTFEGIDFRSKGVDGKHIQPANIDFPVGWTWFAGKDWGWNAPYAFVLMCIDYDGQPYVVDTLVERHVGDPEQAQAEKRMLALYGVPDTIIFADPAMWASTLTSDGIGPARVETFWAAGLAYVKANNDREDGWTNLRNYLNAKDHIKFVKGRCSVLVEQVATAVQDKKKTEDVDDNSSPPPSHMDALNALRYGLMSRQVANDKPSEEEEPIWKMYSKRGSSERYKSGII